MVYNVYIFSYIKFFYIQYLVQFMSSLLMNPNLRRVKIVEESTKNEGFLNVCIK